MLEELLVFMELAKLNSNEIEYKPIESPKTEFISNYNLDSIIETRENEKIVDELAKIRVYAEFNDKNVDRLFDAYVDLYPKYKIKIEPALIYAMMAQESGMYINAISPVGAGGEVQLMPWTAKALGLNVFITSDFNSGWDYVMQRNHYWKLIREKTSDLKYYTKDFEKFKSVAEEIEFYQKKYDYYDKKSKEHFKKYKKEIKDSLEVIAKRTNNETYYQEVMKFDGRFTPEGTKKGVKMFFDLMNASDILGDFRLALCVYNAGRGNVENTKRKGNPLEIPRYIDETFAYQNIIATNMNKVLNKTKMLLDSLIDSPYSSMNPYLKLYEQKREEYVKKLNK